MSIGTVLADARRRSGLTVAQVSVRTRIRQTIIRGIEADDYSVCGGDFYARGHIRSIAQVVGIDGEPLVKEYDTAQRPADAVSAVSLDELLASSQTAQQRRRWPVVAGLAVVLAAALGGALYAVLPGSGHATPAAQVAKTHAVTGHHAARSGTSPVPAAAYAHTVVIHLTAVRGCWVVFTSTGGRSLLRTYATPGSSHAWTFRHAVDMRLSKPQSIKLTVDGKNPLPAAAVATPLTLSLGLNRLSTVEPSPHNAAPPQATLTPVSATAFGPNGPGQGDNAPLAARAIDGNPATAWHTDWYATPRFGNLYPGTGLLLDMGRSVTITKARIVLGAAGARFQLRVGATPALADLAPVAHEASAGSTARLTLATPARGRYVLIWFTRLPADSSGTFQASVYDVSLKGRT